MDIVDGCVTGALAEPVDSAALAAASYWVLKDPQSQRQLGTPAKDCAEQLWYPQKVATAYLGVYRQRMTVVKEYA